MASNHQYGLLANHQSSAVQSANALCKYSRPSHSLQCPSQMQRLLLLPDLADRDGAPMPQAASTTVYMFAISENNGQTSTLPNRAASLHSLQCKCTSSHEAQAQRASAVSAATLEHTMRNACYYSNKQEPPGQSPPGISPNQHL
jgi:hypothetical protein